MFLNSPRKALILYGDPGVGKTSLLKYLYKFIQNLRLPFYLTGFYTEEIRDREERIGFDLIYLKDPSYRLPLARKKEMLSYSYLKLPSLGKYKIFTENLNKFVELIERDLTIFKGKVLLFIDEIGKMEAFSNKFINFLEHLWNEGIPLIATLGKGDHPLLKDWREKWSVLYCEVTLKNRDYLKSRLELEFYRKGKLIVLEGIDGAGKSTIFKYLQKDKDFQFFVFSFEPTQSTYGKKVRELLTKKESSSSVLLELFLEDRKEHVEKLILPSLQKGKNLLLDRYYLSTLAYQGEEDTLLELLKMNETFAPLPDLIIYFEISPELAYKRIMEREKDKTLFEKEEYLRKISKNYNLILPLFNYVALPAFRSEDDLLEEVKIVIKELILDKAKLET